MKLTDIEIKKEEKYLEIVKNILKNKINYIKAFSLKEKEKVLENKRSIYENSRGFIEPNQELIESIYNEEFKINLVNKQIDKLYLYEKSIKNPYFGKLLLESDTDEEIYIGICSIDEDEKFYVYDWRSKIASLFYNYELGNASYSVDSEVYNYKIKRKIQIKIKDGKLLRCFDSSINIDDEYLQEILANSTNDKLSTIVSTIQKEQNEIIRKDEDKNLIVQGVAGSGKTVVALHRIAYLLYKDVNLTSKNILILSPNDIFTNYISDVLPSLGEENTLGDTLTSYFSKYLRPYSVETYSSFISRIHNNKENEEIIKFKLDDKLKLKKFLNSYINKFEFKKKFTINEETFFSKDINYMFNEKYTKLCLNDRFNSIAEYISNKIKREDSILKIKEYLMKNSNIAINIFEIYNEFLKSYNIDRIDITGEKILYEDVTNLVYIYFFINGYKHDSTVKQVVIDEVQDYTLFQLEILRKIFNMAHFTILGDINQCINKLYNLESINEFSKIFKDAKYIELNKTYRSTEEIINYSNKILNLTNVCAIRNKDNEKVEIKKSDNILDINKEIDSLKIKYKKIAIISTDGISGNKIYQKLNRDEIQLITENSDSINKNIVIVPSYLSKGLEFDAIIIFNDKKLFEENKKLYYVSATRALHKLVIYNAMI